MFKRKTKANRETIMIKTKLTLTALVLLLGATQLMAEPKSNKICCQPMPVGGMESLERNTTYPLFDRERGNNADVVLNFYVDKEGNVSNIRITSSGGSMFDRSAIMAVMKTRWSPAMQNGYPVAVTFEIPFEYRSS